MAGEFSRNRTLSGDSQESELPRKRMGSRVNISLESEHGSVIDGLRWHQIALIPVRCRCPFLPFLFTNSTMSLETTLGKQSCTAIPTITHGKAQLESDRNSDKREVVGWTRHEH